MRKRRWLIAAAVVCAAGIAAWAQLGATRVPGEATVRVVAAYPHDTAAFTQGLVSAGGTLYEGTGQYGRSSVRRVDLSSGRVEERVSLGPRFFGEGITVLDGRLYQLTWRSGVGFVYTLDGLEAVETFRYEGEGWGLTHDGTHLIMSDGSDTLRFMDPATFEVVRSVPVRAQGQPVERLNELEHIEGEVWANVWYEDRIARISPADGRVLGWIDVGQLYPAALRAPDEVANGIAYDAEAGRLFVTGKNWPQLFEIEVVPR